MRKLKLKYLVLLTLLVIPQFTINGQSPPIYDKNWVLNTSLSDEFNSTQLDSQKWYMCATTPQYPLDSCDGWTYEPFISNFYPPIAITQIIFKAVN